MKTGIKVGDAMTQNPICCNKEDNVSDCVKKMIKWGVGSIAINDKDKINGIITYTDIVSRVVALNKDPSKTKVDKIMTKNLVKISPKKDLYDAIVLMSNEDIRWLPVISKGKFIGLLTIKDILKMQPTLFDLISEKINIREEENKIKDSGKCDVCDSKGMLFRIGNRWLCGGCK